MKNFDYCFKIWISYNGFTYNSVYEYNNGNSIEKLISQVFADNKIDFINLRFKSRTDAQVSAYLQYFKICTKNDISSVFYKIRREVMLHSNGNIMLHEFEKSDHSGVTYENKTYIYKIINYYNAVTYKTHFYFYFTEEEYRHIQNILSQMNNKNIDYSIFCKEIKNNRRPVQQILQFKCVKNEINTKISEIIIYCSGECFMYKQVRMIIGTILKVIKSKKYNFTNTSFIDFIENQENKKYVFTAPAHALYLISNF